MKTLEACIPVNQRWWQLGRLHHLQGYTPESESGLRWRALTDALQHLNSTKLPAVTQCSCRLIHFLYHWKKSSRKPRSCWICVSVGNSMTRCEISDAITVINSTTVTVICREWLIIKPLSFAVICLASLYSISCT